MRPIRLKVLLGVIASVVTMATVFLLTAVSGQHAATTSERVAQQAVQDLATDIARSIDSLIAEHYRDLSNLAGEFTDPDTAVNPDNQRRLDQAAASSDQLAWIGYADATGAIRIASRRELVSTSARDLAWFWRAGTSSYFGTVRGVPALNQYRPRTGGVVRRYIDISVAILDTRGERRGVLGAYLDSSLMRDLASQVLARGPADSRIELAVVDGEGQLLAATQGFAASTGDLRRFGSHAAGPSLDAWTDGVRYLSAAVASTGEGHFPGTGWHVLIRQPEATAFGAARDISRTVLLWGIGLGLVFLVFGWALSSFLARPIQAMAAAATRIRNGERDATMPDIAAVAELSELGSALRDLVGDLTAKEAELRTLNLTLSARVAERTAELSAANAALVEARAAAEKLSQAKSHFLANMSHELRSPLNAVIGFADLIHMGNLPREQTVDYAQDIGDSARHLLSLINDVLDFSKADAERLELDEAEVDLRDLIAGCLRMMAPRAQRDGLTMRASHDRMVTQVIADERRLKQVMLNLLSNALKYTPAGGSVTVSTGLAPRDRLLIEVRDTGIGISPDDRDVVLQPFGQVANAQNRTKAGTGLGLPLTKRLVELHGGTMEIDSVPNQGTTVRVYLPADRLILAPTTVARAS
ncbi:sensor histidine kinase [Zavarzinia sp. CC-PAN008]|uniref:sensor histidine kinase n=1 Tax=Zavarzinia sp. CC-PAN008 TaxID=3243332 RepID=UPI003F743B79